MMGYQALNEIQHIDNIFSRLGQSRPMAGKEGPSLANLQFFFYIFQEGLPGTCLDLPETLSINPHDALEASQTTMEAFTPLELPGFSCRLSSSPPPPLSSKSLQKTTSTHIYMTECNVRTQSALGDEQPQQLVTLLLVQLLGHVCIV